MILAALIRLLRRREQSLPAFVYVSFARDYERSAGISEDVGPIEARVRDLGESERLLYVGDTPSAHRWLAGNGYRWAAPNIWKRV